MMGSDRSCSMMGVFPASHTTPPTDWPVAPSVALKPQELIDVASDWPGAESVPSAETLQLPVVREKLRAPMFPVTKAPSWTLWPGASRARSLRAVIWEIETAFRRMVTVLDCNGEVPAEKR